MHFLLFLCVGISLLLGQSNAIIQHIQSTKIQFGRPVVMLKGSLYGPQDAEAAPPGNGNAYVRTILHAQAPTNSDGMFEMYLRSDYDLSSMGYEYDGTIHYCCTEELLALDVPGCTSYSLNRLLVDEEFQNSARHYAAMAEFDESSRAYIDTTFPIQETGQYSLFFALCDPTLSEITVTGSTEWMNPYGHLSGAMYSYLTFYQFLSLVFIVVGFLWLFASSRNQNHVTYLQYIITGLLIMFILECLIWYFDYNQLNQSGKRHVGNLVFATIWSILRASFARCAVVAIASGLGVVVPDLNKETKDRLLALGGGFFVTDAALSICVRYGQTNEMAHHWRFILTFPVAIMNVIFFFWAFRAFRRTIAHLERRRQMRKLALYVSLLKFMLMIGLLTLMYVLVHGWFAKTNHFEDRWETQWLFDDGIPVVIFAVTLIFVAYVFRPNADASAYSYSTVRPVRADSDEFGDLEDGVDAVQLHKLGGVSSSDESDEGDSLVPRFTIGDDEGVAKND